MIGARGKRLYGNRHRAPGRLKNIDAVYLFRLDQPDSVTDGRLLYLFGDALALYARQPF